VYKYLTGHVKKMESNSSQWCPLTGQWAQSGIQEITFKHKELIYCESSQHQNRLLREAVESPSLEILNLQLDVSLSNPDLADPA